MSRRLPTAVPPTAEMKVLFGRNLARCREGADVSQEELGFRASIHRTEVSLLERGERMPRVDTALRIAGSLGISMEELVAGLEWQPGYEIVVPGTWEVVQRDGKAPESADETPPDRTSPVGAASSAE
ncbi:MAG TPA: helix-turn-helix transcriptional regulator [Solirubrobacterales bacterium]|nr:helix-turn-helix transcriptional regulator [Solirubrobacterales bacterium]